MAHARLDRGGPDGSLRVIHEATGYYWLYWPGGRKVLEHRYVWEKANGPIEAGYVIHHSNENKTDNRLENLECLRRGKHVQGHLTGNKEHGRKTQEGMRKAKELS